MKLGLKPYEVEICLALESIGFKLHGAPVFGYMTRLAMLAGFTSGDLLGEGLSG